MTKRYITIPNAVFVSDPLDLEDRILTNENGVEQTITFHFFIRSATCDESAFGVNMDGVESAFNIRQSLRGKTPGDVWEIDEDDWKRLCTAILTPKAPYNPRFATALVTFKRTVCDAKTERPTNFETKAAEN